MNNQLAHFNVQFYLGNEYIFFIFYLITGGFTPVSEKRSVSSEPILNDQSNVDEIEAVMFWRHPIQVNYFAKIAFIA